MNLRYYRFTFKIDCRRAKSFISRYYPGLSGNSANNALKMSSSNFSFLSDLVELTFSDLNK